MNNKRGSIALAMIVSVFLLSVIAIFTNQLMKEREKSVIGEQTKIKKMYEEEFSKETLENLVYQILITKDYERNMEQKIIEEYEVKEIEVKMNKILKERNEKERILLTLEKENNPKIKEICSIETTNFNCINNSAKFIIKKEEIEGVKRKVKKIAFNNLQLKIEDSGKLKVSTKNIKVKLYE